MEIRSTSANKFPMPQSRRAAEIVSRTRTDAPELGAMRFSQRRSRLHAPTASPMPKNTEVIGKRSQCTLVRSNAEAFSQAGRRVAINSRPV